mmetsp:Transcript_37295/g.73931  ORF Transcript_37295/g.73931 Transcript_37295/m.73931 type:complete len:372 (+) Transcript_37295:266-1381(+)
MRPPSPTPVRGLLRCFHVPGFIASFEEEGYKTLGDLRAAGRDEVEGFVSSLCLPKNADKQLLNFAFGSEDLQDATVCHTVASADSSDGPHLRSATCCFDQTWLETVAPLYSYEMGCENMGPLLYSLVRFIKPRVCLEVGAGYTSVFLAQALEDNCREEDLWRGWGGSISVPGGPPLTRVNWLVPGVEERNEVDPFLHCVDNLAHAGTTAHKCCEVASKLGLSQRLRFHYDDARAFLEESAKELPAFDFVWLDGLLDFAGAFVGRAEGNPTVLRQGQLLSDRIASMDTLGQGIDKLLDHLWPRIAPGGMLLLHSTLTNNTVRRWLKGADGKGPPSGAVLSLLEPMKKFQNSCTLIQRRPDGWPGEPIYSELP